MTRSFLMWDNKCDACLFTKNRIVSKERAIEVVHECLSTGSHFVCHKGYGEPVACKGFYDAYPDTPIFKLIARLNIPLIQPN